MPKLVAFLRAINVGGRRIASDDLAALFRDLGAANVSTYLASGNVVFESDEPADELVTRIEAAFDEVYGWDVPTFIRPLEEVATLADAEVFDEATEQQKVYVVFGANPLETHQSTLDELSNDVDTFVARGHEIYWLRDMEAGESQTTGELEKALDEELTRRTVRTLERLAKKFG